MKKKEEKNYIPFDRKEKKYSATINLKILREKLDT